MSLAIRESMMDRKIARLIGGGKCNFAIYPYGECGRLAKWILNAKYGVQERFILDNVWAGRVKGLDIRKVEALKEEDCKGITVLVASDREACYSDLRQSLLQYVPLENICDLLSQSPYFDFEPEILNNYMFLDNFDSDYLDRVLGQRRVDQLAVCASEIYELGVQGAVAECGVFRGNFATFINRMFPDRKCYLFDTFEGFDKRDIDEKEEEYSWDFRLKGNEFADNAVEHVLKVMPFRQNVVIRKGYFPETAQGLESEHFAFVNLDMDLYKPIKAGLEFFWPRMSPGGYIFVHDYSHPQLRGVKVAVREFCCEHRATYLHLHNECTAVLQKPLELLESP